MESLSTEEVRLFLMEIEWVDVLNRWKKNESGSLLGKLLKD